jgi:signal transduction histidine kinase
LINDERLKKRRRLAVLDTAVNNAVMLIEPLAKKRKISINFAQPPQPSNYLGDPDLLERVFLNLLANAVKFNRDGGKIEIAITWSPDEIVTEVSDTGIGIAPDKIDKIFDRFYKVDSSSKQKYGGAGIGLALVRDIMDLHGGRVEVQSKPSEGSTFRIILPRIISPAGAP